MREGPSTMVFEAGDTMVCSLVDGKADGNSMLRELFGFLQMFADMVHRVSCPSNRVDGLLLFLLTFEINRVRHVSSSGGLRGFAEGLQKSRRLIFSN